MHVLAQPRIACAGQPRCKFCGLQRAAAAFIDRRPRLTVWSTAETANKHAEAARKYEWHFDSQSTHSILKAGRQIKEIRLSDIKRPLQGTRTNDQDKVQALMDSIQEVGLKEPIDVLEVNGRYYGFSGCHRYEAFQKLGLESIPCRVRKGNDNTLKMHLM